MADQLTIQSNRRQQEGKHAPADLIALLRSTVIAGLGTFGLASNGACLSILTQTAAQAPSDCAGETTAAKLFLVARGGSRVDFRRAS